MSSENALAELRLTTRAEHDRIAHLLYAAEPMTMARYAVVMGGLDAFLRAWEPRVHAALPQRLQHWFRARRRGGFASADVEWLRSVAGMEPYAPAASGVAAIALAELPEVLGSLYVIESTALDGRALAPRLKTALGLDQGRGASFFHGFGGGTGVMWNNFRVLASLEIGESPQATVRACQSARRTYAALIDLFAPLAIGAPPPAPPADPLPQRIAPALLLAFGDDDDATLAAPAGHCSQQVLPVELEAPAGAPLASPGDPRPGAAGDTAIELA